MSIYNYSHCTYRSSPSPAMLVLLAVFCPCHVLGRNAQAIGEHYWTWCLSDAVVRVCLADVNCVLHAFIRQKIRVEKGIEVRMKAGL